MANHLMHHCILGLLSHTTRLLCTHRTEYLEKADVVLLLEAGRLVRAGNAAIGISVRETDGSSAICHLPSVWLALGPSLSPGKCLSPSQKQQAVKWTVGRIRACWRHISGLGALVLSGLGALRKIVCSEEKESSWECSQKGRETRLGPSVQESALYVQDNPLLSASRASC